MIKAPGFDPTLNFDWTDKTPRCVSMLTAAPERTVVWKFNHKNHFKVISQHVYAWGKKFNYYYQHFFSPFFFSYCRAKGTKSYAGRQNFLFLFFPLFLLTHRRFDEKLIWRGCSNRTWSIPDQQYRTVHSLRAEACTSSMSTVINVGQCTVHLFSFLCKNSEAGTSQI